MPLEKKKIKFVVNYKIIFQEKMISDKINIKDKIEIGSVCLDYPTDLGETLQCPADLAMQFI